MLRNVPSGPTTGIRRFGMVTGVAAVALLMLAACTPTESPVPPEPSVTGVDTVPADQSVLDLIGLWSVTDIDSTTTQPEMWLAIDDGFHSLWTSCSARSGSWVSDGERLRMSMTVGYGPCLGGLVDPGPWFGAIRGFELADDGLVTLTDESGSAVATLTSTEAPEPFDFRENGMTSIPVPGVSDSLRVAADEPVLLPLDLAPVDQRTLEGRWTVAGYEGMGHPDVVFADGSYTASDGCNSSGGPLLVNGAGRVRAGSGGGSTQVGCDNVDLPGWVFAAQRAGIDRSTLELVLLDHDGVELTRLVRLD